MLEVWHGHDFRSWGASIRRSVVGLLSKRISSRLMAREVRQRALAPRELPRFIATTPPSDSRLSRSAVMRSRTSLTGWHACHPAAQPGLPGSYRIFRRPPSPLTPGSPSAACARCFTDGVWFRPFWKVDHYHWFNEAETGSRFRITADVFAFSGSDDEVTRAAAESTSW